MNGVLLIDKPSGVSSAEVLRQLQRSQKISPVLGHGGTLDPFATGLLVVLVGRAAKLAQYFLGAEKGYSGVIQFGEKTPTGDVTSEVSERTSQIPTTLASLQQAAAAFTQKPYSQTPPAFSAKKKNGKRAYDLARQGIPVELTPVIRSIYEFNISAYEGTLASFEVSCESGTYIRALALDLAQSMGSLAYLKSLRRTHSGKFSLSQAQGLEEILQSEKSWEELSSWVGFDELLADWPQVEASEEEKQALEHGKKTAALQLSSRASNSQSQKLAVFHQKKLIAVLTQNPYWRIERVFK